MTTEQTVRVPAELELTVHTTLFVVEILLVVAEQKTSGFAMLTLMTPKVYKTLHHVAL